MHAGGGGLCLKKAKLICFSGPDNFYVLLLLRIEFALLDYQMQNINPTRTDNLNE